jgi:hypothetical protein
MQPEYYINEAQDYFNQGELELAEYVILKGIVKNTDNVKLRVALSNIYYYSFRYQECQYELEQIQKLEDKYPYLKESFELCNAKINRRTMNPIA